MKNIYVLPTDKPSRLFDDGIELYLGELKDRKGHPVTSYNIYITDDSEIKEGDWYLGFETNYSTEPKERWVLYNCVSKPNGDYSEKIILTTDIKLAPDVQKIDDEFLEWFVKNPSCEEVEVDKNWNYPLDKSWEYKIIIPKEEPKQRLEKYSERFDNDKSPIGNPETWGKRMVDEPNIIDQWLEKNGNPEITKQVDEEAKKLQKQHLIDMMKQDEELGLYDEQLRKQFSANIEGSKEFNEMCKEEPQTKCYCGHIITCKDCVEPMEDCSCIEDTIDFPTSEIPFEDIFNEEKKKGVKGLIDKHKQKTLEEALKSYVLTMSLDQSVYIDFLQCAEFGAKWQQERSYSEEEVIQLVSDWIDYRMSEDIKSKVTFKKWFEQNKKK